MTVIFKTTSTFTKRFRKLPARVQRKFDKQIRLFAQNPWHPSLNIKKMRGHDEVWEARVDYQYRFTFTRHEDGQRTLIILRAIGTHRIFERM